MTRGARSVVLALLALVAPLTVALTTTSPASADPVPGIAADWPYCGEAPDDDGRYCIVSMTRNGVPVPSSTTDEKAYVDKIGPGDVRFGVINVMDPSNGEIDPDATWRVVVNTGAIEPWAILDATARDVVLERGGSATSHTFTLTFRPIPVARTSTVDCHWDTGCGDDSTVADVVYDGFVTGYVTDGESTLGGTGLKPYYEDFVSAGSAQESLVAYDDSLNELVLHLANPHLKAPGVPFTGAYETFLPDRYLTGLLHVADPSTLGTGRFQVARVGTGSVAFTVTRVSGGVRLQIPSVPFSTPTYTVRTKVTAPGRPRKVSISRADRDLIRVSFRKPLGDGGKPVRSYVARCRHGAGPWRTKARARSPIYFSVPTLRMHCQVRAVNAKGPGRWSAKVGG